MCGQEMPTISQAQKANELMQKDSGFYSNKIRRQLQPQKTKIRLY